MTQEIKTTLQFLWCPDVEAGLIIETSAAPLMWMRLEDVELQAGWQIETLAIGGHTHRASNPDLRSLKLPPVGPGLNVTIRVRNTASEKRQFPGAQIVGTTVR